MRAVIIADGDVAIRERSMLSRLEVGLADEGVRVVHAVPRSVANWLQLHDAPAHPLHGDHESGGGMVHAPQVVFDGRGQSRALRGWVTRWKARRLVRTLERAAEGEAPADVVHAFGEGVWDLAAAVALELSVPLVVELWRWSSVARAARWRVGRPEDVLWLAGSPAIERGALDAGLGGSVRLLPWGVHAAGEPGEILEAGRTLSLAVVSGGGSPMRLASFLQGLAAARSELGDLLCLAPVEAMGSGPVRAAEVGLGDVVTRTPDLESRRELVLQADVLAVPDAAGEERTIVLDALGRGMAVLAASDARCPALQAGVASAVVEGDRDSWARALVGVCRDVEPTRAAARAGWSWVRGHRKASSHVAGVLSAYAWARGGTIQFESAGAG